MKNKNILITDVKEKSSLKIITVLNRGKSSRYRLQKLKFRKDKNKTDLILLDSIFTNGDNQYRFSKLTTDKKGKIILKGPTVYVSLAPDIIKKVNQEIVKLKDFKNTMVLSTTTKEKILNSTK